MRFLRRTTHNKSLDASGGSVFRNLLGAAKGALIRAAASTQPFGVNHCGDVGSAARCVCYEMRLGGLLLEAKGRAVSQATVIDGERT